MRVLHILRKYDSDEWGGTETAIHQLTAGLAREGVESVVFAPRLARCGPSRERFSNACELRRFRAYLPVWGLGRDRRRSLVAVGGNLLSFELMRLLWREGRVAAIHSHAQGRLGAAGLAVARRRRLPFVLSIHGGLYDVPESMRREFATAGSLGWDWGKPFGLLLRSRDLIGEADAVVTCNPREAALIRERHPGLRVMVQPHGVPLEPYRSDHRAEARSAFPEIAGRDVLLMPGRIDPVKNQGWIVDQAADVARRHPSALVLLVGPCTDRAYGEDLRRRIDRRGLSAQVRMLGKLPPGDPRLIGLLQEARAVLLASVSETFGLVILEAWAAGTPVVSSRTSGAVSLVEEDRNGWLFDLEDPAAFHRAVDRVLLDPEARARCGEAGRCRVVSDFDARMLAGRIRGLYEELGRPLSCIT